MLDRLTSGFVRTFERWMPDSFVVAICLTVFAFALGITVAGATPLEAIVAWGDGFWDLLAFTNQIVLTLILGHAVAHTPLINQALRRVARVPRNPRSAYLLVGFIGGASALFSWGLSLVAGAVMARFTGEECKRKGIQIHYPLLVASGFSGFVIWHQGLSSSIGLAIATPGHFLEDQIGVIPLSQTVLSSWSLLVAGLVLATLPFLMSRIHPKSGQLTSAPEPIPTRIKENISTASATDNSANVLERSPLLNRVIVTAGFIYLVIEFFVRGNGLNLNSLNFAFLMLGLALTRSPQHYVDLIIGAARISAPFLLQYPFYAGIAGLMSGTGLVQMFADSLVNMSTAETLPIWSFFSAAILNLFIPSGGGQWAIQGPIVLDAALQLGANVPDVTLGVMLGDQWTNLVHPLVTIPVVAIAGLHVRQILGFCAVALIFTGVIFVSALTLI